jgi:hypothetical protein
MNGSPADVRNRIAQRKSPQVADALCAGVVVEVVEARAAHTWLRVVEAAQNGVNTPVSSGYEGFADLAGDVPVVGSEL